MTGHEARYRRVRRRTFTVTCACGWVSERQRSVREARLAYEAHTYWLEDRHRPPYGPVGVDAHRRTP